MVMGIRVRESEKKRKTKKKREREEAFLISLTHAQRFDGPEARFPK